MTSTEPVILDCQIAFTGTIDPSTMNTAILTILPTGSYTTLPAAYNGTPGLPPVIDSVVVTEIGPTDTMPTPVMSLVDPGGPGEASHYILRLAVRDGAAGAAGTNSKLSGCSDIENISALADGFGLYWDAANSKWQVAAPKKTFGPKTTPYTSFNTPYSGASGSYLVASLSVAAQPFAWTPRVDAQLLCGGTANTKVDLAVLMGDPSAGTQVAYGHGQYGIGPFPVTAGPNPGAATMPTVPAATAQTFYLVAKQVASTADTWSTTNTQGRFSLVGVPV
ncbi:hypothetical protein [Gordonia sp. N1V]|uniref:hypothetical protein n=1 Tax=Gordonia sp. N1V TaxID=3034163 RepID=UPI0023E2C6D7|nr:hypothetical protein [Gordonia sp. N1V]MDF3280930.1 hypothetical protein [Gordonia sp. N1V]